MKQITSNFGSIEELQQQQNQFDIATLKEIYTQRQDEQVGEYHEEKQFKAVFNTSKNKVSSIVSDKYQLVQHWFVSDSVSTALQSLNIEGKGYIFDGGDTLFIDIDFPQSKLYVNVGEEFYSGIRIINSYNKSSGVQVLPRFTRLVCKNGMVVDGNKSLGIKGISIAHNNRLVQEFHLKIPELIRQMVDSSDKFKAMINNCIGDSIEWESMQKIVKHLLKADKHNEMVLKIMQEAIQEKYTRWDLYNAITNYATHGELASININRMLQDKAQEVLETDLSGLMPKIEVEV